MYNDMHVHSTRVLVYLHHMHSTAPPLILFNLDCLGVAIAAECVLASLPVLSMPRQSMLFPTSFRPTLLNLAHAVLPDLPEC